MLRPKPTTSRFVFESADIVLYAAHIAGRKTFYTVTHHPAPEFFIFFWSQPRIHPRYGSPKPALCRSSHLPLSAPRIDHNATGSGSDGWHYLVAIMDWFSRYVLAWVTSITMETGFCLVAMEKAFVVSSPGIFNTDQGSQFTSSAFTDMLKEKKINSSMDGRGRAMDNIFTERLWRSLKYEEIYIRDYQCVSEGRRGIDYYFNFYNHERPHRSLNYMTPAEVYFQRSGEGGKRTMPTSLSSKTSNFRPQSVT
jgi:putative transposase